MSCRPRRPPRPVAGYWASLGLPPEVASKICKIAACALKRSTSRARANSARRLSNLGVRVVKRSPDLTITLVNDYLERQLAELNQKRVADKTPWLLVQPSGVFPLVGPVFKPGESACWTCLFDRMIRNREIKGFLDRGRRARLRFRRWPATRSDKARSSSPPSKLPRRSPPAFAPICATTSQASI